MNTGVSVLLPSNRYHSWMDEAVESLLNQTFEPIEVVVILDGIALPDAPWASDARVTPLHIEKSQGLASALNAGAARARYDLLGRLDADDLAAPERLVAQVELMRQRPDLVLLGTSARLIDEDGAVIGSRRVAGGNAVSHGLLTRNQLVHSSVLMRRDAFERVGGYNAQCRQMEDYDLWLRMACVGEVDNLGEEYTSYRLHTTQMSTGAKPWGAHVRAVLGGRRALARSLHRSASRQLIADLVWVGGQYARYGRALVRSRWSR